VPSDSVGSYACSPRKNLNLRYELIDVVVQYYLQFFTRILPGKLTENTFSFSTPWGIVTGGRRGDE
jgi:hypothetical protein